MLKESWKGDIRQDNVGEFVNELSYPPYVRVRDEAKPPIWREDRPIDMLSNRTCSDRIALAMVADEAAKAGTWRTSWNSTDLDTIRSRSGPTVSWTRWGLLNATAPPTNFYGTLLPP